MRKINAFDIHLGDRFDRPLFTAGGQKLLSAGVPITVHHMRVLQNLADPQLCLADSEAEVYPDHDPDAEPPRRVVPRRAVPSTRAAAVVPRRRDEVGQVQAAVDNLLTSLAHTDLRVPAASCELWGIRPPGSDESWPGITELVRLRLRMVEQVRAWQMQLDAGEVVAPGPLQQVVRELFTLLLQYPTRFTQLALLCPSRDNYVPDHALCVATLAMATAGRMNWSAVHVQKIGLCALIADVGMLRVPERIRTTGSGLSHPDRRIVECHPALSVAMLQRVPTMEPLLKLAAFQHHERETGVGYPTQTGGNRICDYAKVLAVCDVFAAATGPRAYHPGKLPYVVMEEVIRSAAAGIFDKSATRALVRAAGLFPVGSCVLLSTNQFAQVLAANPERLDRPVVRLFNDDGQPGGPVIDLATVDPQKLSVTRPSPPPRIAFPAV